MNPRELRILDDIEAGLYKTDAAFAARISSGPRFTSTHKAALSAAAIVGMALVMLFPANLVFGLTGYVVLVAVGTAVLRRRPLKPAQESPVQFFHRLTAGLFRDTGAMVDADDI